jgi:hypothetical protein
MSSLPSFVLVWTVWKGSRLPSQRLNAPKRVTDRVARMMFVDDLPIVEFGKVKGIGKGKDEVLMIDVVLTDGNKTEHRAMDYMLMLNEQPRYACEILKQEAVKEEDVPQGIMPKIHVTSPADPKSLRESGQQYQPKEIVLTEKRVFYVATVKFVEGPWSGRELRVKCEALNP